MRGDQLQALMLLSGFEIREYRTTANQYWPDVPDYFEVRAANPWWVVQTQYGPLTIGRRKRVWEINWSEIGQIAPDVITQDDVTMGHFCIHAWSLVDALKYLTNLRVELVALNARLRAALGVQP
ncbi:hypothetical protein IHN63_03210 [Deinococcus sp. 6YEL10]|uniref:hypothetical protein n=1 Tax=Deinococcus sp. 6YEL10 TaxID=2745870 RepID=UPI001E47210E|nr:hypothetical protein [Deinococcus sp. 6YEL10]MCD0160309.1 hypothetical protein [Deinococcus sp. 6YEL10]